MTKIQKELVTALFKGRFLLPATNIVGAAGYKLYSGNMNPERFFHAATVNKSIYHVLKKDKHTGRLTLNLTKVRSLRKNSWIKQQYLKRAKAAPRRFQKALPL